MTIDEKIEYFYSRLLTSDNMTNKIYWDEMLTQAENEKANEYN